MIWRRREKQQNVFVEAKPSLGERLSELWAKPDQYRVLKWITAVWYIGTAPFRALIDATAKLIFWKGSGDSDGVRLRHLRHLFEGLPVVVATIGVLILAGVVVGRESYLRDVYRTESAKAYFADRPQDARLFYERLFRLDGGTAETRLHLGLTLEKLNQMDEAERLIKGVAEGDAGGDPRANRWVASKILSDPKSFQEPEQLREAYEHLRKAEQGMPDDHQVKLDLAKYHLAMGRPDRSIDPLAIAAKTDAALNLDLAKLYIATGNTDSAHRAIQRAEVFFRRKLESDPNQRDVRLMHSTCLANLGQLDQAIAVLKEGVAIDPNGPFSKATAKIYVAGYDRLVSQGSSAHSAMITALREALRYDPHSVDAAIRLANFGQVDGSLARVSDSKSAKEAQEVLETLLASGEQPPAVHMALGLKAWREGDLTTATWHFEHAYDQDSTLAAVANNLAWTLAHNIPPDLERALAVITPVVERFPQTPHYRDTRGEILLRLERWNEALSDLEYALQAKRENVRLHESLALVYSKIGKESMATRHQAEAARLKKATSESNSGT